MPAGRDVTSTSAHGDLAVLNELRNWMMRLLKVGVLHYQVRMWSSKLDKIRAGRRRRFGSHYSNTLALGCRTKVNYVRWISYFWLNFQKNQINPGELNDFRRESNQLFAELEDKRNWRFSRSRNANWWYNHDILHNCATAASETHLYLAKHDSNSF